MRFESIKFVSAGCWPGGNSPMGSTPFKLLDRLVVQVGVVLLL